MKKTTQKLLSIVLVLAVVVSTVCGAIIGAYAASADNMYSIVSQGDIAAGTKTITYTVTLTDSQGMTNGVFDLMLSGDVIDDANFGTKLNDKDEIVPDYSNYLAQPNSYTLEDLVGEKTETREETTEVTNDFEWRVDTTTEKQWSATDPDGAELGWQSTGNTQTKDNWVKVEGSTQYATSDPDGDGKVWQSTGNSKTQDNWAESTVNLKLSEVPADTATVKYVQGAKVQDNWSDTGVTKYVKTNYGSGAVVTTAQTGYTISSSGLSNSATEAGTIPANTSTTRWVGTGNTKSVGGFIGFGGTTYYEVKEQTNDPTYVYTKRVNTPVTTYEYQQYKNDIITETEYQKYNKIYFKTTVTYGKSKLDLDGNNIIANVNTYEIQKVEVPVYDADGNVTYEEKEQEVLVNEHKEPTGNKGTFLPNAFDNVNKLWNTKIEITGGTKLDGTEFNIGDFTNDNYSSMADADDTSTQKIEGSKDGVKYVYNMTDDYKEACTKYPSSYTNPVNDKNLLHGYYREYTTVDVATENLGYSISTVSEDCTTWTPQYTQYAQGFKDITFNTKSAYTSITFTVTLDFTGLCDRISANGAVRSGEYIGTNDDGTTYRITDGHSAGENYVHYGKKYQLNLINAEGDVADLTAPSTNALTNFSHVHDGHISETTGKADPNNIEAIKAAGLEKADNKTYFNIFDAKCTICGRVTPMLASTDMPYREYTYDDDGDVSGTQAAKTGMYSFNQYRNLTGVNLTYQPDGTVSLNIHYPSAIEGEKFIITDQNGKVLRYSDTIIDAPKYIENLDDEGNYIDGNKKASFYASTRADGTSYYEGLLTSTSKMITIDNLSAQDVDKVLYIARYTPKSSTETQLMGITHTLSLSDYCNRVINGEAVYFNKIDDSFSETKVDQDKLVAAAFMNYANASKTAIANKTVDYVAPVVRDKIDLLEFSDDLIKNGSTSKYYDSNVADKGETGADWDNAIIIDSAEEFVYLCKASGNETKGKYYKVADDILAFDLSSGNLDFNGTLEDNLAKVQASGKNHAGGDSNAFQGYFDGNGVTVYGAWANHNSVSAYAGLFTQTKGGVIIKNVHVKFASFTANSAAGGIIGYSKADEMCTITIENCSVTDSHIEVKNSAWATGAGAIVGRGGSAPSYKETESTGDINGNGTIGDTIYVNVIYNIKNCYVNLDEDYFITKDEGTSVAGQQVCHGGVVGVCDSNALNVQDSVVIGIKPYATSISNNNNAVQHSGLETHFKNVYTTADVPVTGVNIGGTLTNRNFTNKVFPLSQDKLTGDAAKESMALDWETTWYVAEDGSIGIYAPCDVPVITDRTIYWDGSTTLTAPTTGSGTKKDPYIINSVNELLYIFGQTRDNYTITDGKYYKVADSISSIVLQKPEYAAQIMALSSAADTKAYFEANASKMLKWKNYGWESSTFCGNIDFNGATVYGIYQVSENNAGFISNVDAGTVISNLTIKNSYLKSNSPEANYQAAVLAAVTNGNSYGKATDGFVWFNHVEISNNYVYNNSTSGDRSGVMIGASSDIVYMDNCLVYGNDATYGSGVKMPIWSTANNSVTTSSNPKAPEGLVTVTDNATDPMYYNMVRNSILLGVAPYDTTQVAGARFNDEECFENVYTDMQANDIACADNTVMKTTLAQIKQIDVSKISGINAKSVMPNLDWYDAATNPDGVWHYSYVSTMPSLKKKTVSIVEEIAELGGQYEIFATTYKNIKFETPDTIGEDTKYHENGTMTFGVYQTALNLKANPYLTFAFAFYGEYQMNRDKIQIRFSYYNKDGEIVTTEPISPPAATYTDGDAKGRPDEIVNVNGWTNKKSSGRYHTYTAKDLPIEAMVNGVTVEMNYNNEGWKNYGTFDIEGIGYQFEQANATTPCEYYQSRIDAAKSLVFYINALNLRYGI